MKNILFSYLHKLTVFIMLENIEFEGLPFDFKIMSHPRQYAKEAKINVLCLFYFIIYLS